jgi:hypothetical protein
MSSFLHWYLATILEMQGRNRTFKIEDAAQALNFSCALQGQELNVSSQGDYTGSMGKNGKIVSSLGCEKCKHGEINL